MTSQPIGMLVMLVVVLLLVWVARAGRSMRANQLKQRFSALKGFDVSRLQIACDNSCGIAIDEQCKVIAFMTSDKPVRYFYGGDIYSVELFEDGNSVTKTQRLSQVGGALIGGLALGGVGAVVGGLTGSKKTLSTINRIDLRIIVNDAAAPLLDISFLNEESKKDSSQYKVAMQRARHWHGVIEVLIKSADGEVANKVSVQPAQADKLLSISVADEISKLLALHKDGHLTAEEFQKQKSILLEAKG